VVGFQRIEDIEAWQRAIDLIAELHSHFEGMQGHGYFWLRDQLLKAALSISNNIAEGFGRGSDADFARFLAFARGSALEVHSCLHVAERIGFLPPDVADHHRQQSSACIRLISRLQTYLDPKRIREEVGEYHA
jgi:four helix bundle protein